MNPVRGALLWASESPWMQARMPRLWFVRNALRRFLPGEHLDDALAAARALAAHGIAAVVTHLGEHVGDAAGARAARDGYLDALERIAAEALDVELSLKLTHLGLALDTAEARSNLAAIVQRADEQGAYVWVDMESSDDVDATLEVYRAVRHRYANVGVCVQAYLRRTAADIEALAVLRPGLRLVKGAYREPPAVALQRRAAIDQRFAELAVRLLELGPGARVALATHDVELLEAVRRTADPEPGAYEIQMLYGIRVKDQLRLAAAGHRVRVLIGYGAAWYPWYVRRLAERPANLWFVLRNVFSKPPTRHTVPTAH